jgi:hypothetical protein
MNFGELCDDVITITNRPELVAETQLAVRNATLKFHMIDFFFRDRVEKLLQFSASSTGFQIDIKTEFENWRKFDYIRPYDLNTAAPKNKYIKEVAPSNIFDQFTRAKTDVCYVAGTSLNMRTADAESAFLCGWFKYPKVTPNNFSSWIAEMYPAIIVEEAAGRMLWVLGMVEEGNKFIDPVRGSVYVPYTGHLAVLKANELEAFAR